MVKYTKSKQSIYVKMLQPHLRTRLFWLGMLVCATPSHQWLLSRLILHRLIFDVFLMVIACSIHGISHFHMLHKASFECAHCDYNWRFRCAKHCDSVKVIYSRFCASGLLITKRSPLIQTLPQFYIFPTFFLNLNSGLYSFRCVAN